MRVLRALHNGSARFLGVVGLFAAALAVEMELRTEFFLDPTATYMVASYVVALSLLFLSPKLYHWILQITRRFGPRVLFAKGCGLWLGLVALFLFSAHDEARAPARPNFPAPYGDWLSDWLVLQLLFWSATVILVMIFPFGLSYRVNRAETAPDTPIASPLPVSLLNLLSWVPLVMALGIAAWGQWGIEIAPDAAYQAWVRERLLVLLLGLFAVLFLWPLWVSRRPRPPLHSLGRGVLWVVAFLFVAGNLLYRVLPFGLSVLQSS